jgi:hypothetical protein
MESQEQQGAAERSFRMARPPGRAAAGIAAAVAVVSFAFLVFGPLSDQRALALAGVGGAGSAGRADGGERAVGAMRLTRSASGVPLPERVARTLSTGLGARLAFGMVLPP